MFCICLLRSSTWQGSSMTRTAKVQCMLPPFNAFVLCIRCFLFICCAREVCLHRGLGMVTGTPMKGSTVKFGLPKCLAVQGDLHQAAPRLAEHLGEGLTQAYWRAPTWRAFVFWLRSAGCPAAASWLHDSLFLWSVNELYVVCMSGAWSDFVEFEVSSCCAIRLMMRVSVQSTS